MADDPTTPPDPPEGYWEDFQTWAMTQFQARKTDPPTAPPPDPKTDPPADPPKKRKAWFASE